MPALGPDDFTVNRLVTVLRGPFHKVPVPFSKEMFGTESSYYIEDKSFQGKVFRIVHAYHPFIVLAPLDGVGQPPEVRTVGPMTIVSPPTRGIRLDLRDGVELGAVDSTTAKVFEKWFCPPKHRHANDKSSSGEHPLLKLVACLSGGCGDPNCPNCGGGSK